MYTGTSLDFFNLDVRSVLMARVLGIIGGGQLGMMLTEAARAPAMRDEISEVVVLDPTEGCPASQAGAEQIVADFKDAGAIKDLSERADVITYEIESGDSDVLESVECNAKVEPSPRTLRVIQDKYLQKSFLAENGIPVPDFVEIRDVQGLADALDKFGYPALLKARRDAYDGRGNYRIRSPDEIETAYAGFEGRTMMLERFVPFEMEVSVIAARNTRGDIKTYPLVENMHEDNILRTTIAPARVPDEVATKAENVAERTLDLLKGAGVFGIEMFVAFGGDVLIKEIAPRVHNSGHHTLQSSATSQFEQHLRAILGMDLGSTELMTSAIMYNILGTKGYEGRYADPDIPEADRHTFLKMYGKSVSKPMRKLGHVNLTAKEGEGTAELLARLDLLRPAAVARPA